MKKILKRFLIFALVITLTTVCAAPAYATEHPEGKTIRIDYDAFIDKAKDGTFSGYGVALLNSNERTHCKAD